MYTPKHHKETDLKVLHGLIKSHSLGTWITRSNEELVANHIPFLLDSTLGDNGTLVGHVARANPVWKLILPAENSLVIFQGAENYITPSWYPSKQEHGRTVPTWNYAVVHAYGMPRIIEDKTWLLNHLNQLTNEHEKKQETPWAVGDAPEEFIEKLLNGIVGIEIPINKLEGKWKVSQNKNSPDKLGVVKGLLSQESMQAKEMAAYVSKPVAE